MYFPFYGGLNGDPDGWWDEDQRPDCDGSFTDGYFIRDPNYYHTNMTKILVKLNEVGKTTRFHFNVVDGNKYPFHIPTKLVRYQNGQILIHKIGVQIAREALQKIKVQLKNAN